MGLKIRLLAVLLTVGTLSASGCFIPTVSDADVLAIWDIRQCDSRGRECGPYRQFVLYSDGTATGEDIFGSPMSGTWTDRGDGTITMEYRISRFPFAGITDVLIGWAEVQLSGGTTVDTATTFSGSNSETFLGVTSTGTAQGIRVFP